MKVVAHHSEQELERLASREKRADTARRLRTVLLAKRGERFPVSEPWLESSKSVDACSECADFERVDAAADVVALSKSDSLVLNPSRSRPLKS